MNKKYTIPSNYIEQVGKILELIDLTNINTDVVNEINNVLNDIAENIKHLLYKKIFNVSSDDTEAKKHIISEISYLLDKGHNDIFISYDRDKNLVEFMVAKNN